MSDSNEVVIDPRLEKRTRPIQCSREKADYG